MLIISDETLKWSSSVWTSVKEKYLFASKDTVLCPTLRTLYRVPSWNPASSAHTREGSDKCWERPGLLWQGCWYLWWNIVLLSEQPNDVWAQLTPWCGTEPNK